MATLSKNLPLIFHNPGSGYLETVTNKICEILYGKTVKMDVKATLVDVKGGNGMFPIYTFMTDREGTVEIESATFSLSQSAIGSAIEYTTVGNKKNNRILATKATTSLGSSLTGVSEVKCLTSDGDQLDVTQVSPIAVAGARTYTITTNFVANDTIAIGGVTLTAKASGATGLEFNVGTTIADSATNLQTVLAANTTVNAIYNVTVSGTAVTLTEKTAGGGNTPAVATVVGTGVVASGTATTSAAAGSSLDVNSVYVSTTGDITWGSSVAAGEYTFWFKSDSASAIKAGMLKDVMPEVSSFTWMLPAEELDGDTYQVDLYIKRCRADGAFNIDATKGTASIPKLNLKILDPGDGTDDFATIVVSKVA